jgi:hypothetical protein
MPWDQEIVLDPAITRDRTDVNHDNTPARIYSQLKKNEEFRVRFGDRVQKHLFGDGALTPENNIRRWRERSESIEDAIVGESARWGDARVEPPLTQADWLAHGNILTEQFFPAQQAVALERFRNAGLYPNVYPPALNQNGGRIPPGFKLHIRSLEEKVWVTLDGTDPRTPWTGAPSEGAFEYLGPLEFQEDQWVKARCWSGGSWSALVEADFTVDTTGTLDSDMDGIPDEWEMRYGLFRTFPDDAGQDPDADGYDNLGEYRAGTDPHDPEDYLLLEFHWDQGALFAAFLARSNRHYALCEADTENPTGWNVIGSWSIGGNDQWIELPLPTSESSAFFQLKASPFPIIK